ncbi:MAG: CAP domain-containing protein [Chloroflexota bacterium]
MASSILTWLNRDRAAAGLRPLRAWTELGTIANQRSANMAATQVLSHTAAGGDPGKALTAAGLQWYGWGEIIGMSGYPWGSQAAANLYKMWYGSPLHHQIMFSRSSNYIGIGIARAADGSTWSSILFAESTDHTRPSAYNGSLLRSGTSIKFFWSGKDPLLQTHTAGIKGYNIGYRVNGGAWVQIRTVTTGTWLGLSGRKHGSTYSFRVQAVDRRGNLSGWTVEKKVYVP